MRQEQRHGNEQQHPAEVHGMAHNSIDTAHNQPPVFIASLAGDAQHNEQDPYPEEEEAKVA